MSTTRTGSSSASLELCSQCQQWDFQRIFRGSECKVADIALAQFDQKPDLYDARSLEDICLASQNCNFCALVIGALQKHTVWETFEMLEGNPTQTFVMFELSVVGHTSGTESDFVSVVNVNLFNFSEEGEPNWEASGPCLQQFTPSGVTQTTGNLLSGRLQDPTIDFELISSWIRLCRAHPSCRDHVRDTQSFSLTLVDISAECIVEKRVTLDETDSILTCASIGYAALSYAWGPAGSQPVTLTQDTRVVLSTPGALSKNNSDLPIPRTIRDAMIVSKKLDIQYLWVDSLCIDQQSADIERQLAMMNEIYEHSCITIVAAAGEDCHFGLPGVRENSRPIQPVTTVGNVSVMYSYSGHFEQCMLDGYWAGRGWTFQECIFPRRLLIFSHWQCYFICKDKHNPRSEGFWCEPFQQHEGSNYEIYEFREFMDIKRQLTTVDPSGPPARAFFKLAEACRRRNFTYRSDLLRALGGVMMSFSTSFPSGYWHGLPVDDFGQMMIWDYCQYNRYLEFPSWSWAGWMDHDGDQPCESLEKIYPKVVQRHYQHWELLRAKPAEVPRYYRFSSGDGSRLDITPIDPGGARLKLAHDALDYPGICRSLSALSEEARDRMVVFQTKSAFLRVKIYEEMMEAFAGGGGPGSMCLGQWDFSNPTSTLPYLPYFPEDWFYGDDRNRAVRELEFVQIGRVLQDQEDAVLAVLMLVETSDEMVSSKISLAALDERLWLAVNPVSRWVFLT